MVVFVCRFDHLRGLAGAAQNAQVHEREPVMDISGSSDDAEEPRDRRLANLRPFKKGASGNPSGTSKAVAELRALARAHSPKAFGKLVELLQSSDERVALMAAKEILDRGFGRPAPAEEGDDERTVVVQIVHIDQSSSSSS
jgi:hypothetical protein